MVKTSYYILNALSFGCAFLKVRIVSVDGMPDRQAFKYIVGMYVLLKINLIKKSKVNRIFKPEDLFEPKAGETSHV